MIEWHRAIRIADAFMDYLRPNECIERLAVAGSIRRKKKFVHDIEVVAKLKEGCLDYFREYMYQLVNGGVIDYGKPNTGARRAPFGPRYYRIKYRGEQIDLFIVYPPAQWGVIYAIRTGSAKYSKYLMILAKKRGYKVKDGGVYKDNVLIPTPTEYDFFKLLGFEEVPDPTRRYV